jgi:hypothetical protein
MRAPGQDQRLAAARSNKTRLDQARGYHQDEPAQDVLVVGAHERREISDRAQVGVSHLVVAVELRLLDLQLCQCLVRLVALGGELGPVPALVGGRCMAALVRPFAVDFSAAPSIWPILRSRSATWSV